MSVTARTYSPTLVNPSSNGSANYPPIFLSRYLASKLLPGTGLTSYLPYITETVVVP
jgi:hypothetical protein